MCAWLLNVGLLISCLAFSLATLEHICRPVYKMAGLDTRMRPSYTLSKHTHTHTHTHTLTHSPLHTCMRNIPHELMRMGINQCRLADQCSDWVDNRHALPLTCPLCPPLCLSIWNNESCLCLCQYQIIIK